MQTSDTGHDTLGLSGSELHVLRVAGQTRRGVTAPDAAERCGLSDEAAAVRLRHLRNEGFVDTQTWRVAGRLRYYLTDEGRRALASADRARRSA